MTTPAERAIVAITRILNQAHTQNADTTWTAHALLDALQRAGWRPTEARPPEPWQRPAGAGAPPTADYLATRPRSTT